MLLGHAFIKNSKKAPIKFNINPLLDVWRRQRNQPTIINVTIMPNFNENSPEIPGF